MVNCVGFPKGHVCLVEVDEDTTWCRVCREKRQAFMVAGLAANRPVPVGVVLESFDALTPPLRCRCGGLADSADHVHSLSHAVWAWQHDKAQGHRLDGVATVQHRQRMREKEQGHDATGQGATGAEAGG